MQTDDRIFVAFLRPEAMRFRLWCGCTLERRPSGEVRFLGCAEHGAQIMWDNGKRVRSVPPDEEEQPLDWRRLEG